MKKGLIFILILGFNALLNASPKLLNFEVNSSNTSRVYFESSEIITGSLTTGFIINGVGITGVNINTGSTTGHYLTVNTPFTFWDNNSIRYEGGGNIQNIGGDTLIPFTLTYIDNNITEPSAAVYRYVTTSAIGGGDGLTELTAWTLSEAFNNATAGQTVWIKAGDYGDQHFTINLDGTAISPIKFIGYKNAIGDITSNYWDYGVPFSTNEMPTITGTQSGGGAHQNGRAIYFVDANYIILRNFQLQKYPEGISGFGQLNSNIILDKVNGYDFAGQYSSAFTFESGHASDWAGNANCRFLNMVVMNYEMQGLNLKGDGHCLIENCKIFNDDPLRKPDYQITFNGDNNIVRNNYIEIKWDGYTASTHGIGVRGAGKSSNNYNLIEGNEAVNINECYYVRNVNCDYNVIKHNIGKNNGATSTYRGGVLIWGGSDYNIVESNYFEDMIVGIGFKDNFEEDNLAVEDYEIGKYNIIRNNIFNGFSRGIGVEEQTVGGDGILYDNYILNNTFYNGNYLFSYDDNVDVQRLNFTNNTFHSISNYKYGSNPTEGEIFTYDNFYNCGFTTPVGTGNISVNSQFVNAAAGDFHLLNTSSLINAGTVLTDVMFDYEGNERSNTGGYDIGAYEYDSLILCVNTIDSIEFIIDFGDSILFGGTYYTMAGAYYDSLLSQAGCDSIMKLKLNINNFKSICRHNSTIVIDGIEDIGWELLDTAFVSKASQGQSLPLSSDLSATFQMFWDDSSIYALIKVVDDTIVTDNGTSYWHDDGISFFIDGGNEDSIAYDVNDVVIGLTVGSPNIYKNGTLYTQSKIIKYENLTATGYLIELEVKWSEIGITPVTGNTIGFDLYVTDDDDGGSRDTRIMWNDSTSQSLSNPSFFGAVELNADSCDIYYTTSVNNAITKDTDFIIFPNPSNGSFTIDMEAYEGVYSLQINNSLGQLVHESNTTKPKELITLKEKGVYFIRVTDKMGAVNTQKLIIR